MAPSTEEFSLAKAAKEQTLTIPPDRYPLLATSGDITDPTTVRQVDLANLATAFWPGVSLKRIMLEITDEPMTEGMIESALGWLKTIGGGMLGGRRITTIAQKIDCK